MFARLKQLARDTMIYGVGSIAAKVVALLMLPLYTYFLSKSQYGISEAVMTIDLFLVAVVKLGLQNSMFRFYYDEDHANPGPGGTMVVRTVMAIMLGASLLVSAVLATFAHSISSFYFHDSRDVKYIWIMIFGIFTMTIYQTLTATFRLEKRPVTFMRWTLFNVGFTVLFTVLLVAVFHFGAVGLLMGNFLGTAVLIPGVVFQQHRFARPGFSRKLSREMVAFGVPTMPMALANQGLTLIDRTFLTRTAGLSQLGLYSLASKMSQVVLLVVMALQMSWQPFAYSIADDEEARRVYATVMTWYVASVGWLVIAASLLADPLVRLLTRSTFYDAALSIPLLAVAAGVYGMYFIAGIGASRVKKTQFHVVVASGALITSFLANLVLTTRYGNVGAAGAAVLANGALSGLMFARSQHVFRVPYAWGRMARAGGVVAVAVALAYWLPRGELWTLAPRIAGVIAVPFVLKAVGFFPPAELAGLKRRFAARKVPK
ncbi:MAG TPA: oligosaccharide flippase family protein [Burkholderiaceae bacterium]